MEEQWINDLRKKMASHQTPVPPGLWEGIATAMKTQQAPVVPLRRRVWLWSAGIASVAAVAIVVFLLTYGNGGLLPEHVLVVAQSDGTPVSKRLTSKRVVKGFVLSTPISQAGAEIGNTQVCSVVENSRLVDKGARHLAVTTLDNKKKTNSDIVREKGNIGKKERLVSENRQSIAVSSSHADRNNRQREWITKAESSLKTKKEQLLAIQIYTGNLTHSTNRKNGYGEFVVGTTLPQEEGGGMPVMREPVRDIIFSNKGKVVETHKKHILPITFGISARYYFHPRWSLESGLRYTYLSSELTSGTDSHHFVTRQRLHYLGIPLNLNFDIWKNRAWNFYMAAGGALEKCVRGKSVTEFTLNQKYVSEEVRSVMDKPLQWSVNGFLGMQFNFSRCAGVYLEPGISYFFNNGSPVENIYKEKPFNFNFKLGFRYSF